MKDIKQELENIVNELAIKHTGSTFPISQIYLSAMQQAYNLGSESKWILTSERLPDRAENERYSQVQCLCVHQREVRILVFNHEHECWDQEDGDDYCCDIR